MSYTAVMRLRLLICFGLLAACGGQGSGVSEPKLPADTALEKSVFVLDEALPPAVYDNDSGVQLTIIALAPEGGEQKALIQFKGIRHPLSGKVVLATAKFLAGGSYAWLVRYQGQMRWLVRVEPYSRGVMKLKTILVLPMTNVTSVMQFSPQLTRELEWQSTVALHEKHVADGSLLALSKVPVVDMVSYKKQKEERFHRIRTTVSKACGEIPLEIAWSTVTGEPSLEDTPCAKGLELLADACTRSVYSKGVVRAKTKRIVCSSGPQYGYSSDNQGTLTVMSNREIPKADLNKELASEYGFGNIVVKNESEYLIFNPDSLGSYSTINLEIFIGDGVTFHKHRSIRNYPWSVSNRRSIHVADNKWVFQCNVGGKHESYTELDPKQAEKVLSRASYGEQTWKRTPVSLSRDSRGQYFFVDRLQKAYGGKDFRVFKGLRGRLKQTQLIDIIDDGKGRIFSTKQGDLRLLLGQKQSTWIAGKSSQELTLVWEEEGSYTEPSGNVATLIYKELGVYDGLDLDAICY